MRNISPDLGAADSSLKSGSPSGRPGSARLRATTGTIYELAAGAVIPNTMAVALILQ